ncbi:MAG: hypothetical protein NC305_01610 [Lachnospiraceae bacterium]|nr:hypothetical protein [Butyrivibrio sp.]MCM1342199.1 hypothetical protein [Muribaculaceae bacterium]MCM1409226.1 hypothetical protein [Lachnospiraceae bacterium]
MRKRVFLFLLVFCLLLPACASADQAGAAPVPTPDASDGQPVEPDMEVPSTSEDIPAPELSERDRNWINDIHYLQNHYKKYHPDPFYLCSEEEFDQRIDWLCQHVDSLSDNDIFFELAAIIAGMGDIHTNLLPPDSFYEYLFPISVSYFDGRLYLTSYLEGYEQFEPYLLREIVAVNGVDIGYLEQKFECITHPDNTWCSREIFRTYYFIPAFFEWAGCGYQDGYTFQILDENQQVQSVEASLVPYAKYDAASIVLPESWAYLADAEAGNRAEYRQGDNGGYVYMALERIDNLLEAPYRELFEKAAGLLEAHPECGKLVIDLRSNPGGYLKVVDYLREDVQLIKTLPIDQTYVLIGGYTMSAAIGCISLFKEELNAVTVGEPAGQFTSHFTHSTPLNIVLPQSQLSVSVSTGWYEGDNFAGAVYDEEGRLYEWENTILPDVYIHQDIEDIRLGKNSALEWVLAQ